MEAGTPSRESLLFQLKSPGSGLGRTVWVLHADFPGSRTLPWNTEPAGSPLHSQGALPAQTQLFSLSTTSKTVFPIFYEHSQFFTFLKVHWVDVGESLHLSKGTGN